MQIKLWTLLKSRGISQATLAKKLGISEKTLSQKMQGKADFWYTEVVQICRLLDIKNPLDCFKTDKRT